MKAILIIDMPKKCDDCPLMFENDCGVMQIHMQLKYGELYYPKPSWCPLKPFPKYYPSTSNPQRIEYLKQLGMTEKEQYYYELGHDDCIDEKLGED